MALTKDERQQVTEAREVAAVQAKENIANDRASRRVHLDEGGAVEAWAWCWVHLDLREFTRKEDVPWPPYRLFRLAPRSAELDNYYEFEGDKAARNWVKPGDLWRGHHRIDPPTSSAAIAIEAHPSIPYRADWYGLWVRLALFGEVESFTREGRAGRWVVHHGMGHVRQSDIPDREMLRGTQARVTGVAGHREGDTDTAYLHYSHWWFPNGRKYPTTEALKDRAWLAGEVAALWEVPVLD